MNGDANFGLSGEARSALLDRLIRRRAGKGEAGSAARPIMRPPLGDAVVRSDLRRIRGAGQVLGIENPFFRVHEGIAGAETVIGGRGLINLVSYNYIGLNGDPRVLEQVEAAMRRHGTSVSASRLVSGERPIHHQLEAALARVYEAEDCVAFVSGHATNVTVISHLVGANDLILHDVLAHNSIIQGALLSGARRVGFAHNDLHALEQALRAHKAQAARILIVIEGHYSMDGDVPDLAGVVALARQFGAYVMVDEAHSLGVLGSGGRGIAEHAGVSPRDVDIWMGTLSKTLCSCGGYIAASNEIVDYLRCSAPGFVYSVGLAPPMAAAALACLQMMEAEPWRVAKLNENAALFLLLAKKAGIDTGGSIGAAIVPVIIGSSIKAARVADLLFQRGINVQPILYPAVPERSARLRVFLSSLHSEAQIRTAVAEIAQAVEEVDKMKIDLVRLAMELEQLKK